MPAKHFKTLILLAVTVFLGTQNLVAQQRPSKDNNPKADMTFVEEASPPTEPLTLWYRKPATDWETQALPIGNGRMAAMVFGGVNNERIQFNEETVWDGVPIDHNNPEALEALPEVRRLLFEGKNSEATKLASQKMMGKPTRIKSYQTLADLQIVFPSTDKVAGYRRDLDLTTGINRTCYSVEGIEFTREVFASTPDQVIVVHLKANQTGKINFTAKLDRKKATTESITKNRLVLRGKLGVSYEALLHPVVSGGTVNCADGQLTVADADEVMLLVVGATSYNSATDISGDATARCEKYIAAVENKSFEELRSTHIADHQKLFNRVELDLGTTDAVNLPTDERVKRIRKGEQDPQFEALYF